MGIGLAIWSAFNHVAFMDATVVFWLAPEHGLPASQIERDLPLGYVQQLNYGPWITVGIPVLLAAAAIAWRTWNTACASPANEIPTEASLEQVSSSIPMSLLGIALAVFLVGSSIQVEVRDYKSLGLGWVQARSIHDASEQQTPIPGYKFKNFAEGGRFRTVTEAHVRDVYPPQAGVYRTGSFIAFVGVVKALSGLWQATVIYLALLFVRVGVRVVRHMRTEHLHEQEGTVEWTIRPAIGMFFVGALTHLFSTSRYVANMAKGSYGSWDQYASFLVISPGLATSVLAGLALYLVYVDARGRQNPWGGTPKPYAWALGAAFSLWVTTGAGVIRLLVGLSPATAQQVTEWLQHTVGAK